VHVSDNQQIGFLSHWDPYAVISLEAAAYTVHIVTQWGGSGWTEAYLSGKTGFLQCFDAVGRVIWPVKIVREMTYKVSSGTLNLCSLTH